MISKDRLWEIWGRINVPGVINFTPFQCGQIALIESLIEECGEDDTLAVSKLRPMIEVKDFADDIQVFYSGEQPQSEIYYWDALSKWHYAVDSLPMIIDDDYMLGFIPAVKYKP